MFLTLVLSYDKSKKDKIKDPIDNNFSIDRASNEFLLISLSTPSTFSDYEFLDQVVFGPYLLSNIHPLN